MAKYILTTSVLALGLIFAPATATPSPQFNLTKLFKTATDATKAKQPATAAQVQNSHCLASLT